MVEMAPEHFLAVVPEFGTQGTKNLNPNQVDWLAKIGPKHWTEPPMLKLDGETVVDHDGRHRAKAAIQLGLKSIKVRLIAAHEVIQAYNHNHGDHGRFSSGGGEMHAPDKGASGGGAKSGKNLTLGQLIPDEHPAFKEFPQLKKTPVIVDPELFGYKGGVNKETGIIHIGDPNDRKTLLHELQHKVQEAQGKTGFDAGGNSSEIWAHPETEALRDTYVSKLIAPKEPVDRATFYQILKEPKPEGAEHEDFVYDAYRDIMKAPSQAEKTQRLNPMINATAAHQVYLKMPGEKEAREAENWTPKGPWKVHSAELVDAYNHSHDARGRFSSGGGGGGISSEKEGGAHPGKGLGYTTKIGNLVNPNHPAFHKFPHLKEVKVTIDPMLERPGQVHVALPNTKEADHIFIRDPKDRGTLLHELHHLVMKAEGKKGGDLGGSIQGMWEHPFHDETLKLAQHIEKRLQAGLDKPAFAKLLDISTDHRQFEEKWSNYQEALRSHPAVRQIRLQAAAERTASFQMYRNLPGEVAARKAEEWKESQALTPKQWAKFQEHLKKYPINSAQMEKIRGLIEAYNHNHDARGRFSTSGGDEFMHGPDKGWSGAGGGNQDQQYPGKNANDIGGKINPDIGLTRHIMMTQGNAVVIEATRWIMPSGEIPHMVVHDKTTSTGLRLLEPHELKIPYEIPEHSNPADELFKAGAIQIDHRILPLVDSNLSGGTVIVPTHKRMTAPAAMRLAEFLGTQRHMQVFFTTPLRGDGTSRNHLHTRPPTKSFTNLDHTNPVLPDGRRHHEIDSPLGAGPRSTEDGARYGHVIEWIWAHGAEDKGRSEMQGAET
jgi:hypothetical protein